MVFYSKNKFILKRFEKSKRHGKMYDAVLQSKSDSAKFIRIPFGDSTMQNYGDKTGLNLYPELIHGDKKRRKNFRSRSRHYVRPGFYSPGYFSYNVLW